MKNIVLVGFPGSGKSTIGRSLAAQLNRSFADLDAVIEAKYRTTIPQLFEKYGEFAFRKCEYSALMETLAQEDLVIATGGGTPCFEDAMEQINRKATSVYLKLSEACLVQRLLLSKKDRPLTHGMAEAEIRRYVQETLPRRAPHYEKAHFIIEENLLQDPKQLDPIIKTLNLL